MFIDSSAYKKTLASDPLTESINLINALAQIIQNCPVCLAKLKESKLNKNNAGVTSPSQVTATIATNQANYYDS